MRVFIALELPNGIKKDLERIQKDLKTAGVQVKWVKPEIAHLTLAFLGSITPQRVEIIENILEEVAREIKPARLKLHQLGCFPSPTKTRIIFVSLQGELGKLNALAIKIRKRLKKEKIYFDEKPFTAHITLGRIKKPPNLTKIIGKIKLKREEFMATTVSLTKSTLKNSGPIYQALKEAKLGKRLF
jgi:2'-5' RNA ligase